MRLSHRMLAALSLAVGLAIAALLQFVVLSDDDETATSPPATRQAADALTPTGTLLALEDGAFPDNKITRIDFTTNSETTVFTAPMNTRIIDFALSPDGSEIVIAIGVAGRERQPPFTLSGLYRLPLDAPDDAVPVVTTDETGVFLLDPLWSPDDALYYVRFGVDENAELVADLLRYDFADDANAVIFSDLSSPRLAPDGSSVTFIRQNDDTFEQELTVRDITGDDERILFTADLVTDIDLPLFSPDGAWVYFSLARDDAQASGTGLAAHLLGVQTARAHPGHIVASNWWRVPIDGGEAEALTTGDAMGAIVFGDFDDAGDVLYFATINGLFAMHADGSDLTQLRAGNRFLSVAWVADDDS